MDDFALLKLDDDKYYSYGWYKIHKLSNGQTIGIYFFKYNNSRNTHYYVFLGIANKKKHLINFISGVKDVLTDKTIGRCGLEGLFWAKKRIN